MRLMLRFAIPAAKGNQAAEDGSLGKAIEALIAQVRPEAAYFMVEDGKRAGLVVFEVADASELPGINEPLFKALDAEITLMPALTLEDLRKGLA